MRSLNDIMLTSWLISILALTACGTANQSYPEGLQILEASDQAGVSARYVAGTTRLELRSSKLGADVVANVTDEAGNVLTRIQLPSAGLASGELRTRLEFGAAGSLEGLRSVAGDRRRATELIWAYYGAAQALEAQLPPELGASLRHALLIQPSVLSAALTHLDPAVLRDNPNLPPANDASQAYIQAPPAGEINDDNDDYYAEAVYQAEFVEPIYIDAAGDDSEIGYRYRFYRSGCHGACGPGCAWCVRSGFGINLCYTNSFCQWHDDHCGSYLHFFDCR